MATLRELVALGQRYLGVPYVYGGTTPKGFDCSGLMQYLFRQVGISLPRTSQEQARAGIKISPGDLSPGDLILSNWGEGPNSHIAMYVGNGQLLEAPRPGKSVQIIAFNDYYRAHADGYRRVTSKKTGTLQIVEPVGKAAPATGSSGSSGDSGGGGLLSWPGEILGFFKNGLGAIEDVVAFFTVFFQPSTYVRIGAGLLGAVCVLAGFIFLVLQARQS